MSTNATPADSAVNASSNDLATAATTLIEQFPDDAGDEALPSVDDIVTRLDQMVNGYNVPLEEATRATRNHYLDVLGIEYDDLALPSQSAGDTTLDEINTDGQWVSVTVKVVDLWEPTSDSIAQAGLIGDESGRLKFTKWAKADLPELDADGDSTADVEYVELGKEGHASTDSDQKLRMFRVLAGFLERRL